MTYEELAGKLAYEAYRAEAIKQDTEHAEHARAWDDLELGERHCWQAGAWAVREHFGETAPESTSEDIDRLGDPRIAS